MHVPPSHPSQRVEAVLKAARKAICETLGLTSAEARVDAHTLMCFLLQVDRTWLLTHENTVLEANIHKAFQVLLERRLKGEPIAYILGKREFYGLEFKVTADTLIPRPDTETLVEVALEKIPRDQPARVLDLGTGTGAIAIAIAKHRPLTQVTAVDQSAAALAVAEENANYLGARNVKFAPSDWFSALSGQTFDVIVSNPPYIAENDAHLKQGDLRFEPMSALASGTDGLDSIRHIISQAPHHLNPEGWLMLEHGYNQSNQVAALMQQAGYGAISSFLDLSGLYRVTAGRLLP
jgi:release factor glutamine methyltransferase